MRRLPKWQWTPLELLRFHGLMRPMPTTTRKEQDRWTEIAADPVLQDLPYKVETNARGQPILSPHANRHSRLQKALLNLLDCHAPEGESFPEYALATSQGIKVPDAVWMSPGRAAAMQDTGDPSTLAPEICVEVLSESNTVEEMSGKHVLHRETGAEEVWIVDHDGRIQFFREEEIKTSEIAPACPPRVWRSGRSELSSDRGIAV